MFGRDEDAVRSMPRMRKDCHQISAVKRKDYLSGAKYPAKPENMSSRKRMRNESDDEISLTVSNKDIFSSSDDHKSSEETDDASNEGESSEETNDSDEEVNPWRALIDEATAELYAKHNELVQSLENEGLMKLTRRNKPLRLFYQSFARNWKMFMWIACNGCRN